MATRFHPHTKIVGTLGPASTSREAIRELMEAGLNVARINFSHGTHVGSSRVDLQACKLEYSIVSPK